MRSIGVVAGSVCSALRGSPRLRGCPGSPRGSPGFSVVIRGSLDLSRALCGSPWTLQDSRGLSRALCRSLCSPGALWGSLRLSSALQGSPGLPGALQGGGAQNSLVEGPLPKARGATASLWGQGAPHCACTGPPNSVAPLVAEKPGPLLNK